MNSTKPSKTHAATEARESLELLPYALLAALSPYLLAAVLLLIGQQA